MSDKDDKKAYVLLKEIEKTSLSSKAYYYCFEGFAGLLSSEKSYVRTRGFICCCIQAKWDEEGKLGRILPEMLRLLHDEKPTVIRQCLKYLIGVVDCKPELSGRILEEIDLMDLSGYKATMIPLIKKDIEKLKKIIMASDK